MMYNVKKTNCYKYIILVQIKKVLASETHYLNHCVKQNINDQKHVHNIK